VYDYLLGNLCLSLTAQGDESPYKRLSHYSPVIVKFQNLHYEFFV